MFLPFGLITSRSGGVCKTWYRNKHGCPGLSLDVDNTEGGNNGAETITWETVTISKGDFTYLMFVQDYSRDSSTHLHQSQARVALYGFGEGGKEEVVRMQVPTEDENQSR